MMLQYSNSLNLALCHEPASSWWHDTSPSKLILPEIPLIQHHWIWPKMASCLPSQPWWWDLVDIAQPCVDIGFFLPHKYKFLPPLGVAHCITNYSLQFSKRMAQSFLIGSIRSNAYLGGHARWQIAMTVTRLYEFAITYPRSRKMTGLIGSGCIIGTSAENFGYQQE